MSSLFHFTTSWIFDLSLSLSLSWSHPISSGIYGTVLYCTGTVSVVGTSIFDVMTSGCLSSSPLLYSTRRGLDWTGLDWTGLDWTGLDWTGITSLCVYVCVCICVCYSGTLSLGTVPCSLWSVCVCVCFLRFRWHAHPSSDIFHPPDRKYWKKREGSHQNTAYCSMTILSCPVQNHDHDLNRDRCGRFIPKPGDLDGGQQRQRRREKKKKKKKKKESSDLMISGLYGTR